MNFVPSATYHMRLTVARSESDERCWVVSGLRISSSQLRVRKRLHVLRPTVLRTSGFTATMTSSPPSKVTHGTLSTPPVVRVAPSWASGIHCASRPAHTVNHFHCCASHCHLALQKQQSLLIAVRMTVYDASYPVFYHPVACDFRINRVHVSEASRSTCEEVQSSNDFK